MRLVFPALVLALAATATAQLTDLPGLSQITGTATNTASNTASRTGSTGSATGSATGSGSTRATNTASTATSGTASSASNTGSTTNLFPSNVVSSSSSQGRAGAILTNAPTLQGVGIPTMIVPYTASAPYMQKSTMPEGTVFIAVGAVLAFLGFCVVAWRALVAWSINRSVKRAALASIMASDTKNPGGWAANPFKPAGGFYKQAPGGSTMSFSDAPTSKRSNAALRNPIPSTGSGLFFSPTASTAGVSQNIPMTGLANPGNRSSGFLPAGYYASPTSQVGGGHAQTTVGGVPPYAQPTGGAPSPGLSARRSSPARPISTNLAPPASRDGARQQSLSRPGSQVHLQPSMNSLRANTGHEDLPGGRAPSAYLDDLFDGHHGGAPPMPGSRDYGR